MRHTCIWAQVLGDGAGQCASGRRRCRRQILVAIPALQTHIQEENTHWGWHTFGLMEDFSQSLLVMKNNCRLTDVQHTGSRPCVFHLSFPFQSHSRGSMSVFLYFSNPPRRASSYCDTKWQIFLKNIDVFIWLGAI